MMVLSVIIIQGCGSTPDSRLLRAEELMVEKPDSSLSILLGMTQSDFKSDYDVNVYNILLAEARYKSGYDDVNDSLIAKATDYFEDDIKNPYRLKAYYYRGIINNNAGNIGEALIYLKHSEETALLLNDKLWLGLIYRALGDSFCIIRNPKSAKNNYKVALHQFRSINSNRYIGDSMYDLSRTYLNCFENDSARLIATAIYAYALDNNDSILIQKSNSIILEILTREEKYDSVISMFDNEKFRLKNNPSITDLENLGVAYLKLGRKLEAKKINNMVLGKDTTRISLMRQIAEYENNYKSAYYLYLKYSANSSDIYSNWLNRRQEITLLNNYELLDRNKKLETEQKSL